MPQQHLLPSYHIICTLAFSQSIFQRTHQFNSQKARKWFLEILIKFYPFLVGFVVFWRDIAWNYFYTTIKLSYLMYFYFPILLIYKNIIVKKILSIQNCNANEYLWFFCIARCYVCFSFTNDSEISFISIGKATKFISI